MQALTESVFLLRDSHLKIGADRGPYLNAHAAGVVAEETAQAKVLLDPAEKQLDLPATAVDFGDREGGQMKGVRQEYEREASFRIEVADTPKGLGVVLATLPEVEADRLVAPHSGCLVYLPGLDDIKAQVALAADHEESLRGMKPMQPLEIHVAAIDHIEAVRMDRDFVEGSDLVPAPFVKAGEDRDVRPEIEQHVELHSRMSALPPRPWGKCQAQLDQGRIQSEQGRRQIRLRRLIDVQTMSPAHQDRFDFRKYVPVSLGVCISQIAGLDLTPDAGVVKQLATRLQAGLDVTQALAICQLRKNHRRKMIVRGDCRRRPAHRVTSSAARELLRVQTSENLRQHRCSVAHRAKMAP